MIPLTRSFQTTCFILGALLFGVAYTTQPINPMAFAKGPKGGMHKPRKPRLSDTWHI